MASGSPEQILALRERLASARLDLLLINAGISDDDIPVAKIDDATFNNVMVTNALAPMRIIETFQDLVTDHGTEATMSSGQASISRNDRGDFEVYRASKSALNQLMRSYAARHRGKTRSLLLVAPGWVQTGLGGPGARMTVEERAVGVVDTIEADHAIGELRFVNYQNQDHPLVVPSLGLFWPLLWQSGEGEVRPARLRAPQGEVAVSSPPSAQRHPIAAPSLANGGH